MKKLTVIIKYLFFPFLMSQAAGNADVNMIPGNNLVITGKVETADAIWVGSNNGLWITNIQNHKTTHLTTENSILPSNKILGLSTTADGNVYAATEKGVFRYDGYSYLLINAENSNLPESGITSIASDNGNNLWIGTNSGLVIMNNYKCHFLNTSNSIITDNKVVKVKSDEYGNILAQLNNGDILRIGQKGMTLTVAPRVNVQEVATR